MKEIDNIENCLNGIDYAITDIETELTFIRRYLLTLKEEIENGCRRDE